MKKLIIVILFILGIMQFCAAQNDSVNKQQAADTILPALSISKAPRFILNIHSGYAYGLGSTFKFYPDDVNTVSILQSGSNPPQKSASYRNPWKGLGDGFRFGGGLSFILNDFINLGMDVDYFKSTISKVRDSSYREIQATPPAGKPNDYSYKERTTISYEATLISLTPHITFKAISRPKWFIYNKLGGVITFRPNSLQVETTDIAIRQGTLGVFKDSASNVVRKYDWNIKNPAWGFMGAFGIQVKIAGKLRAFGELQFSHIVFIANKRTLIDFIVDGKDIKNTLPVNMREIEFVKSFSTNIINNNPNEPSQALVQRIPITYIGGQVGLAFHLR